jgi:hypothetical protein
LRVEKKIVPYAAGAAANLSTRHPHPRNSCSVMARADPDPRPPVQLRGFLSGRGLVKSVTVATIYPFAVIAPE